MSVTAVNPHCTKCGKETIGGFIYAGSKALYCHDCQAAMNARPPIAAPGAFPALSSRMLNGAGVAIRGLTDPEEVVKAVHAAFAEWYVPPPGAVTVTEGCHPSHKTRLSDASSYDEICVNCGATDTTGGWGALAKPCPAALRPDEAAGQGEAQLQLVWVQNLIGYLKGTFPLIGDWKEIFIRELEALPATPRPASPVAPDIVERINVSTAREFLLETSRYFERKDTGGEDKAFWANATNADNCRKIADLLAALIRQRAAHYNSMNASAWRRRYWQRRAEAAEAEVARLTAREKELLEALKPLARLEVPKKPQGNAAAYSIRHADIERARAAEKE